MRDVPQCPRLVPEIEPPLFRWWRKLRRRRPELVCCGLYARHDGDHVPFDPGVYLRAPLIHPLDRWNAWRLHRCPCGRSLYEFSSEGPIHDMQWENDGWVLHDVVMEWQFGPCGCVYRDICDAEEA